MTVTEDMVSQSFNYFRDKTLEVVTQGILSGRTDMVPVLFLLHVKNDVKAVDGVPMVMFEVSPVTREDAERYFRNKHSKEPTPEELVDFFDLQFRMLPEKNHSDARILITNGQVAEHEGKIRQVFKPALICISQMREADPQILQAKLVDVDGKAAGVSEWTTVEKESPMVVTSLGSEEKTQPKFLN